MNEKSILIIEDAQDRIDWFFDNLKDMHLKFYFATNAREALAYLKSYRFDCVFFDHDLGDDVEDSSWILNQILFAEDYDEYKIPLHTVIHSSNTVGVKNVASKLAQMRVPTQIIPFENLKQSTNFQTFIENLK